jgi:hypothetical protein
MPCGSRCQPDCRFDGFAARSTARFIARLGDFGFARTRRFCAGIVSTSLPLKQRSDRCEQDQRLSTVADIVKVDLALSQLQGQPQQRAF